MKTRDGFKVSKLAKIISRLQGITAEAGSRHPFVLKYSVAPVGICALAGSTSVQDHIVPWIKKFTDYSTNQI